MSKVFGDSYYFFALLSESDEGHPAALAFTNGFHGKLVTSEWVLLEVGDGLAGTREGRERFLQLRAQLTGNPAIEIIPFAHTPADAGIELYRQRPDKRWTLTDCISFEIMARAGIREAATADHHFEQAGYVALLKSS